MRDDGESAVSSVVGTILMLAVTVSVFTGFSIVALDYVEDRPTAPRSDLALVTGTESLYLVHRGGESFSGQDGVLVVNHDEVEVRIPLTDPRLAGIGDAWDLGDQLCIRGDAAGCLYAADEPVGGAYLVTGNVLMLETGTRASNLRSDLSVALVSMSPAAPGVGSTVTWTVRVSNDGDGPMSRSSVLVDVEVDGVVQATATVAGPIPAGSSATATSTSWAAAGPGTKALRLTVDPLDTVAEEDEGNNQATSTFELAAGLADPGEPFIDLNGDGLYTPGVDGEMSEAEVAQLQGGSFDAGSGSLVIPPSIGDITASTVSFTAGGAITINADVTSTSPSATLTITAGGDVTIGSELTATDSPMTITSTGGDLVFSEASLAALQNNKDITLSAANGGIQAAGLEVSAKGSISMTAGGAIDLSGATVQVLERNNQAIAIVGGSVDLDGATVSNVLTGGTLTVRTTAGPLSASGVAATTTGNQFWKSTGGGITLDGATLAATSGKLEACIPSSGHQFSLGGTLTFTDTSGTANRLEISHGTSTTNCTGNANSATATNSYVANWPGSSATSPRNKVENGT